MKVVLDINIIISGFYSKRGASYQLLQAAIAGELIFVISPLVAFEYEGKLRQKIDQGFLKVSKEYCGQILDTLFAAAVLIWKPVQIKPVLQDSSDDKILECAISGSCTHIVSFNKRHFPKTITHPYGIDVAAAGEFLRIWRNSR